MQRTCAEEEACRFSPLTLIPPNQDFHNDPGVMQENPLDPLQNLDHETVWPQSSRRKPERHLVEFNGRRPSR